MNPDDHVTIELHNSLYKAAADLIMPNLSFGEQTVVQSEKALAELHRGCDLIERVIRLNPKNWNAMWIMGMARKAAGEKELAYEAFFSAFSLQQEHPDVARELGDSCIELGKGEEAIQVTRQAMRLAPNDAGLVANHALALFISGQLSKAIEYVERSIQMDPTDPVTLRLRNLVEGYRERGIPPPAKWPPD